MSLGATHRADDPALSKTPVSLAMAFRIGNRVREITRSSAMTADVNDALIAILTAGGGIAMAATFITAPPVIRGELFPVLSD
jgi:ABC-type sulfate transport system permease subunit